MMNSKDSEEEYSSTLISSKARGDESYLLNSEKDILFNIRVVEKGDKWCTRGFLHFTLEFQKKIVFKNLRIFYNSGINWSELENEDSLNMNSYCFKHNEQRTMNVQNYSEIRYEILILYKLYSDKILTKKSLHMDLIEKKYTDLTLTSDKGTTLSVHKLILQNISPVFKKIINSEMKEALTNNINIFDVNPSVLREFVNYIYDKSYDLSVGVQDMFRLAHMYEVKPLQDECEVFMLRFMTVEDIVNTLKLFNLDFHSLDKLKDEVEKFIAENEIALASDEEFVKYYLDIINPENIHTIFPMAMKNSNKNFKNNVLKFIRANARAVYKNKEFRKILLEKPAWNIKITDYFIKNEK